MVNLLPRSYYDVNPQRRDYVKDAAQFMSGIGDSVNSYAYAQPRGSVQSILLGADRNTQMNLGRSLGKIGNSIPGISKEAAYRFAASPAAKQALRFVPGLTAAGTALAVGDIVLGDESFGNKAMDTAAMGIGGTIGGFVGMGNPLAIAGGATLGKTISDGTQWLFGDKKSPEERRMEIALAQLQGGGMV